MAERVRVSAIGRLGIVELDRPEAINALDSGMIAAIGTALERWRGDASIAAVLFEGRGERGFCAGGDVRAVRDMVLAGATEAAEAFFAAEYRMNAAIAHYPKPTVAIVHGAVMGGGIGIAGHCAFRFARSDARFAMPEAAIGFVADVGVNAMLARIPVHRARLFLMTGRPVGASDGVELGLCDAVVDASSFTDLRQAVLAAAHQASPRAALANLVATAAPAAAPFCELADCLAGALSHGGAPAITTALKTFGENDPAARDVAALVGAHSPTSLEAIVRSHDAARRAGGLDAVLAIDLAMARTLIALPDFCEGVRAVLVDKDRRPKWRPTGFEGVRTDLMEAALRAAGAGPAQRA